MGRTVRIELTLSTTRPSSTKAHGQMLTGRPVIL
jgi:hypothetical protein